MKARRAGSALLTSCAAVMFVAACSGGTTKTAIDAPVQAQLRSDVAALAAAAASHDTAAAQAALTALDSDAAAAHTAGKLSSTKLSQIRAAEAALHADLASSSPTPAPTTPSSTAPAPPPKGKGAGKHDKPDNGKDGRGD